MELVTVLRGRDCQFESDCNGIQNTSCVPDPRDLKLRCLCGDNEAPVNGVCKSKLKGKLFGIIISVIELSIKLTQLKNKQLFGNIRTSFQEITYTPKTSALR